MSSDKKIKEQVIKNLQKEAISQEFTVRRIIEKLKFDEEEINFFISNNFDIDFEENEKISSIKSNLRKLNCSFISRFFYESVSKEGEPKQRELDIIAYYDIADTENMLFMITLLGDIKKTDDYKWVFAIDVTSDEAEHDNFNFPMIDFNRQNTFSHFFVNSISPLYRNKIMPIATYLTPLHPNGNIIKDSKRNRPRNFCEQIINGFEHYYLSRMNHKPDSYHSRTVFHIIIPILITSSNYYSCKKLPPETIEELEDTNSILFLFNPSQPSILNKWRIPILIVSESHLEKTVKDLILMFKSIYWKSFA